jgi:GTP-sensing pleiotropic transcriptional regulator CodY
MLRDYGVDINDPVNLARMVEDVHRVIHTNSYYGYVRRQLLGANSPEEIRAAMKNIKTMLERLEDRAGARTKFPPQRPPKI